jgi:putative DNA primase/helicase
MTNALNEACQRVGIIPRQVPNDNRWHQTDAEGKHAKNGNGRIKMFTDGTGGMIQNWGLMDKPELFWIDSGAKLSPIELDDRRRRTETERQRAEKELAEERAKAAEVANSIWEQSHPVTEHKYLTRKRVSSTETMRMMDIDAVSKVIGYHPQVKGQKLAGNILIIPIAGKNGITSIEMIDETGKKAALSGGQKAAFYWMTVKPPEGAELFVIGEGVATVLSAAEAMQCTGVAALSCHNLKAVTGHIRSKYPAAKVIVLSDIGNGEQSATGAAALHGCYLAKPVLPVGSTGTDFNDVHVESGLDEVRRQIETASKTEPVLSFPPVDPLTDAVTRMAKLSPLQYEKVRRDEAKILGVRPAALDSAVKTARKEEGNESPFADIEPWPEPVNGATLLTDLAETIRRFIICEPHNHGDTNTF